MSSLNTDTGLGLYVHVPFCASTCDFCAFYQEKPRRGDLDNYLQAMEAELDWIQANRPIDTLFWGGGTPGLLPAKDLERLGKAVLSKTQGQPCEWTVEMAPSTVKVDKLKVLKDLGVNRISMGVQSFNEKFLEGLGRLHRPNQIYKAYDLIREAGFDNVNLDLMIALPGQGMADLEADLSEGCRLAPEHLSTYCLTFEEDTALWVKLSQGKIKQDLKKDADLYERTWDLLNENGYAQYEISNFAKEGHSCLHNLNTWRMHEWIGVGPSAASQYAGYRYNNTADLNKWQDAVAVNVSERDDVQVLSQKLLFEDAIIFGLRMNEGVNISYLESRLGIVASVELYKELDSLVTQELATRDQLGYIKLTQKGRLLADRIAVSIMDCQELVNT